MNAKFCFLFILVTVKLFAQPTYNYLSLDAIDDYVEIYNSASIFPDNKITFEGWFNTNRTTLMQPILEFNTGIHFWINVPEPWFGTGANLIDVSNGYHIITFNPNVDSLNWNHLAVTYDGLTGDAIVYLNGEQKIAQNLGQFILHATGNIIIGHRTDGNNFFFNGGLCEIRLWNVVRSNAQILETMNVQLNEPYLQNADSGLVGYWKLDMLEDLGIGADGADDVRDYSYKQNHGDTYGVPAILTDVTNDPENIVNQFKLEQNYPNPFNPVTTIRYTIPTPPSSSPLAKGRNEVGFVTLKVYDVLGNEVATLVNEEKSAGTYEVMFNPESSIRYPASGIYFYQLKAGNYLETKKMILMK